MEPTKHSDEQLVGDKLESNEDVKLNYKSGASIQKTVQTSREISDPTEKEFPIHYYAWKGEIQKLKNKLKGNSDINKKNPQGLTALHYACISNQLESVKILVENEIDLDIVSSGLTAIMMAATNDSISLIKYLHSEGALIHDSCDLEAHAKKCNAVQCLEYFKSKEFQEVEDTFFIPSKKVDIASHVGGKDGNIDQENCTIQ